MPDQSSSPTVTKLIAALPSTVPFVGPEAIERQRGRLFKARLGANENGFGPSPSVVKAIQAAAQDVWQYGDPENYDLKQALAQFHNLKPDNIMLGAGVDALLGLVVRQYIAGGETVINSLGGYPTFNYHVAGYGGKLISVPYKNDYTDLDALSRAAHAEQAKIVYLANPDNPLGTWHECSDIENFIASLPSDTLLILDEAYGETAPLGALPDSAKIWPNVLRMRTFSKAYGLAGMRCGYVMGQEDAIGSFDKIRDHFAISRLTQIAALQALEDQEYLQQSIAHIKKARQYIMDIASSCDLKALPSATNFVAIDCGKDGAYAEKILNGLIERDIFVRKPFAPVLNRLIRVSVGREDDMTLFAQAFKDVLHQVRGE